MTHFTKITSFAELKRQYRKLAIEHHPDKGGDTQVMQQINAEFDQLYKIWEHRKDESATNTGYETDFEGASSAQYQEYVYNEYRWRGSRYNGQRPKEIIETVRAWLKKSYPRCKFSARRIHYSSLYINLIHADFEVFVDEYKGTLRYNLNHYHIENDKRLTERAREVMSNVCSYIMSYNYDNSDAMTDYFDTNFYLNMGIGEGTKPFKVVVPKLASPKGQEPKQFKHPEGKAHKAIRLAMGGAIFSKLGFRDGITRKVLGDMHYHSTKESFYAKHYSAPKTAQKRIAKLTAAGIVCHLWRCYVVFEGYTPETQKALADEVQAEKIAREKWEQEQQNTQSNFDGEYQLIDYSDKSFAIVGDTKPIKEQLKSLGGRFSGRLSCGAGWIFPKSKIAEVKELLKIA